MVKGETVQRATSDRTLWRAMIVHVLKGHNPQKRKKNSEKILSVIFVLFNEFQDVNIAYKYINMINLKKDYNVYKKSLRISKIISPYFEAAEW